MLSSWIGRNRLRLPRSLYRDLLNALPAAIYTTDGDGRITFYNEAAVAFSGAARRLGPILVRHLEVVLARRDALAARPVPHGGGLKEGRAVRGWRRWRNVPTAAA
jgi:PAS domain-containing protein